MVKKYEPKIIKKRELPQCKHDAFCQTMISILMGIYKSAFVKPMLADIKKVLKTEKLAKSIDDGGGEDDKPLKPGWTGDVPKLSVDLSGLIGGVIDKYILALRYVLLGIYAGKKAKEAAADLGIDQKYVSGAIYGTFLHSIDTQRKYYHDITGDIAPNIKISTLKESFNQIQGKVDRMAEESLYRFKNKIIDIIDLAFRDLNQQNLLSALDAVSEASPEDVSDDSQVEEIIDENVTLTVSAKDLGKQLKEVADKGSEDFERLVETTTAMASSTGTQASLMETWGPVDADMKAALVNLQDPACCEKCSEFARNLDGSLRVYPLSAFKPSGWNYGRKKSEWRLTIPGIHPRCRCVMIYIPSKWSISDNGDLIPPKKKE